ncbi:MAG: hypothetical protein KatS3mg131_0674 [Candidatus Tectimicrobiota bacterium]|nr:MAG: hypothetical protein KatS3mg131_0674 [Candidatus Tectomicrobia bacterium]
MLSRYVRRHFVRFFSLALGACTGLMVLITVLDRMDEFLERHVLWQDAALYVVLRLPQSAWQMTPAAFLLASVLTFGALSKHRELLAMQAAGVAPLRLVRPLLVLGGMGCLAMLVAREALLPAANQASRLLWRTRIRHEKLDVRLGLFRQGQIWYRAGNRVWHVQHSQPLEGRLLGVTIYELDAEGTLRRRYDAAEARWQGGGWLLRQGTLHAFTAEGGFAGPPERFAERRLAGRRDAGGNQRPAPRARGDGHSRRAGPGPPAPPAGHRGG